MAGAHPGCSASGAGALGDVSQRPTTDVLLLIVAGTICGAVLLAIVGVAITEIVHPESDTSLQLQPCLGLSAPWWVCWLASWLAALIGASSHDTDPGLWARWLPHSWRAGHRCAGPTEG